MYKIKILYYLAFNWILHYYSTFRLKKIRHREINSKILGFSTVKNEVKIIKSAIKHYRELGVTHFIIVDNNSTDGTFEFLKEQEDITLYSTKEKFKNNNPLIPSSKKRWMTILLDRYAQQKWCVGFDADELFIYKNYENEKLSKLIEYLESRLETAMRCLWIDMYSSKKLIETDLNDGPPLSVFNYFDKHCDQISAVNRVFGWKTPPDKTPLFKYSRELIIDNGWHRVTGKVKYSELEGAALHFPFHKDLVQKARDAIETGAYYKKSEKYSCFYKKLKQQPDMNLMHQNSAILSNSSDLYNLNLIKWSEATTIERT